MKIQRLNKSIPVRKDKIISFRIGDDESEELNAILKHTGVPARSQSSVLRLAIPFIHRSIQDGMALGAADVGQDKPFNKRYERYRNGNNLDFLALGYNIGFRGEDTMLYRVGKAQGEMDARTKKPDKNVLNEPLSVNSSNYAVGYFDGYHGGYMAGLLEGSFDGIDRIDRHITRIDSIYDGAIDRDRVIGDDDGAFDRIASRPLLAGWEHDPVDISCSAIGYRTGLHSLPVVPFVHDQLGKYLISLEKYNEGSLKGTTDRDAGEMYNPCPDEGSDSYMDEKYKSSWIVGYHDGYQGGCAAGMLEGEADRNNGKPYHPPSGEAALTDFAIGYRTAYRQPIEDDLNDFEEYKDGRALGMKHRKNGQRDISYRTTLRVKCPGFYAAGYSSFSNGYCDGYGVDFGSDSMEEKYFRGYRDGLYDRENGKDDMEDRTRPLDASERAGYRAGYSGCFLRCRPTEPKGLE